MIAVIILVVIAIVAGVMLSVASVVFAVPVDEKQEAVRACLPGANCGACGYSGCDGYAKALAEGTAENGLCSPGGADTAEEIAEVLGIGAGSSEKKVACVMCQGNCNNVDRKTDYQGVDTCQAVSMMFAGDSACSFGCLGHGDCERVCPAAAIRVCNGVAVVDEEKCIGCTLCVKACPKKVIQMVPAKIKQHVRCVNGDKGADTRKVCKVGCIACQKCVKGCPKEAISMVNNHAVIDYEKCINCGKCKRECPVGAIE